MQSLETLLLHKIDTNQAVVGILGLGYVGLPLAVHFAQGGLKVLGFEKDQKRADKVNKTENYIGDVRDSDLKEAVQKGFISATCDFTRLKECDAIIICVPTPLDTFKKPDMSYIEAASFDIGAYMKPGTFVSLESTTYPTTTEDLILPIIQSKSGLKVNESFWLCFSAERVDPGNKIYNTANTPKVVGGMGPVAQKIGMALYAKAIQKLHPVSSPKVAEMTKILENTYRLINISMINEMALLCNRMDIDIWEVIEAAKTKPHGFQAFYPGPGIGGHCIPLDPFYLEHIAKNYNFDLTMINTAGQIDKLMPHKMVVKISFALNKHKKALNGSKVLFLGVAYKADINDMRESPALPIIEEVIHKGAVVTYHDPHVPVFTNEHGRTATSKQILKSVQLTPEIVREADCVVVTTRHTDVDYAMVAKEAKLIVDLRNAYDKKEWNLSNLVKL